MKFVDDICRIQVLATNPNVNISVADKALNSNYNFCRAYSAPFLYTVVRLRNTNYTVPDPAPRSFLLPRIRLLIVKLSQLGNSKKVNDVIVRHFLFVVLKIKLDPNPFLIRIHSRLFLEKEYEDPDL
jgi:hypothetical protein